MDRSVQKRFWVKTLVAATTMVGLAIHANAGGLTPGKWRSRYVVLVNNQNSTAVMAQFAAQLRSAMPSQFKTGATVSVNGSGTVGGATVCMTPQVASTLTSPTSVFNMFAKMNPRCTLVAGQATANSVPFTGRCDDPVSYTGNVTGEVSLTDSESWDATIEGVGRFPDALLATMKLPTKSVVSMKTTVWTTLISKTCL